jgi:hypothetical protein
MKMTPSGDFQVDIANLWRLASSPVSRGMTATAMKGKILRHPHMEDLSWKRKQTRGIKERVRLKWKCAEIFIFPPQCLNLALKKKHWSSYMYWRSYWRCDLTNSYLLCYNWTTQRWSLCRRYSTYAPRLVVMMFHTKLYIILKRSCQKKRKFYWDLSKFV